MSGERTVIRPNPGGALDKPVTPAVDGNNERTVIGGALPISPQPAKVAPGGAPVPSAASAEDDWLKGNDGARTFFPEKKEQAKPIDPARKIPLEVALGARVPVDASSGNPLLAAAQPLLILLGRLRLMIVDMNARPLMTHVASEIETFEQTVTNAGVPSHDVQVAKYVLCGTADDIVQNLPGTDSHVWLQYSMLAQFFQVRTSGIGFFEELKKVLANPAAHYDLLELMHASLSLGFEGQYRTAAGGDAQLANIRRDVYQALRRVKARNDDDISPRWRGVALGLRKVGSIIPIWALLAGAAAFLVGAFMLFRFLLASDGQALVDELAALHPAQSVTIDRQPFSPFSGDAFTDSTQLERLRAFLKPEIDQGLVGVDAVGESIVLRMNNLVLFASGRADTKKEFIPVAARVAAALEPELGPINITGHTDNVRLRGTGRFKNNQELSLARANAVREALEAGISDSSRFLVEGRGAVDPIATNKTREGRAKNRRVDLLIPREETLR